VLTADLSGLRILTCTSASSVCSPALYKHCSSLVVVLHGVTAWPTRNAGSVNQHYPRRAAMRMGDRSQCNAFAQIVHWRVYSLDWTNPFLSFGVSKSRRRCASTSQAPRSHARRVTVCLFCGEQCPHAVPPTQVSSEDRTTWLLAPLAGHAMQLWRRQVHSTIACEPQTRRLLRAHTSGEAPCAAQENTTSRMFGLVALCAARRWSVVHAAHRFGPFTGWI
jgi:hypothetical protein